MKSLSDVAILLYSLLGNRAFLQVPALTGVSLPVVSGEQQRPSEAFVGNRESFLNGSWPLPGSFLQKRGKGKEGSVLHD